MPNVPLPPWLLSLLTLAGRYTPNWRGSPGDHFDGRRFRNVDARPHHSWRDVLRWQLSRAAQERWVDQPGPASPPQVPQRVTGDELRVTYINHASILIQHRGLNIVTDPLWGERTSPFAFIGPRRHHPPGLTLDQLPPIDLILVSHNHYDHLDLYSLTELARRFPEAKVVTGLGNAALIRACGCRDVQEIDWWQSVPLAHGMLLTGVPVQHWSARTNRDTNRSLWLGFVLESPDGPVLFPGDSGLGPEFALIRQRFGPLRFAALPIGAYEPRWFMGRHHMNPADAVQAHRILESQCSMAIHFGTFKLSDEDQFAPPRDLAEALAAQGVDPQRFRVPQPGEHWRVDALRPAAPAPRQIRPDRAASPPPADQPAA
ncbi:metal-dependent hydrolase [compost metagenome]